MRALLSITVVVVVVVVVVVLMVVVGMIPSPSTSQPKESITTYHCYYSTLSRIVVLLMMWLVRIC